MSANITNITKKKNLWGVEESYSPSQFYTKSCDDRGHSTYTRLVRIQPAVVEQIEALIAAKEIPAYRSVADFFRDSIIHRLAYIRENVNNPKMREKMSEILRLIHLEQVTQRLEDELTRYEELREKIANVCERSLQLGDNENLGEYLSRMHDDVDSWREPFRSQLLALVKLYQDKL